MTAMYYIGKGCIRLDNHETEISLVKNPNSVQPEFVRFESNLDGREVRLVVEYIDGKDAPKI